MKKAFSLIELSIVLLIIGIIIAGVTQGSRLIQQFRIQTARNATKNSPVTSIKDLALWYETSMETSFDSIETEDGSVVTNWYDNNSQAASKINASGSGVARPTFQQDVINHLPVLRFDGDNDKMDISDGSFLIGTEYTIFLVAQRRAANAAYVLGGTTANFYLGYSHSSDYIFYANGSGVTHAIETYAKPIPVIITASLNPGTSLRLWVNGGVDPDEEFLTAASALTSWNNPSVGRYNSYYFEGDVAEVIIFTRILTIEERMGVEEYLGKKYNITIE